MEPEPARAALDAFRTATASTPERRAANLRAIETRLHAREDAPAPRTIGRTTVIVAALAAAAIAAWIVRDLSRDAIVAHRDDPRSQARDEATARPTEQAIPARPPAALPAAPAVVAPPPVVAPAPKPRPERAAPRTPALAPADALARETALVSTARAALKRGDTTAATDALATLDRELPDGELLEERALLRKTLTDRIAAGHSGSESDR